MSVAVSVPRMEGENVTWILHMIFRLRDPVHGVTPASVGALRTKSSA